MSARRSKALPLPLLPLPSPWDGTAEGKERLHGEVRRVLTAVAAKLRLVTSRTPGFDCEIRSNVCGPVVGGYVYLFADTFHVIVDLGSRGEWGPARDITMYARRVRSRVDYASCEPVIALDWELLWDPAALADVLRTEGLSSSRERLQEDVR